MYEDPSTLKGLLHWIFMETISASGNEKCTFLQVYEGLVYMDFSKHLFETQGYGSNMFDIFKVEMQIIYHYGHCWSM